MDGSTHVITPPCYFGTEVLPIDENGVPELGRLTDRATKRRTDPKLGIMSEMYLYAMSCELRKESRFIELAIILEMLLLPKSSSELAYRFALRFAKLLSIRFEHERSQAFSFGKKSTKHGRDSYIVEKPICSIQLRPVP